MNVDGDASANIVEATKGDDNEVETLLKGWEDDKKYVNEMTEKSNEFLIGYENEIQWLEIQKKIMNDIDDILEIAHETLDERNKIIESNVGKSGCYLVEMKNDNTKIKVHIGDFEYHVNNSRTYISDLADRYKKEKSNLADNIVYIKKHKYEDGNIVNSTPFLKFVSNNEKSDYIEKKGMIFRIK